MIQVEEAGAMTAADPRNWMWAEACAMNERELTIVAALPGVEPPDIEISIERDALLIAGVQRLPTVARGTVIHRVEIPHGRFERRIRLPGPQWEVSRSTLVNGCLLLSLTQRR